MAAFFEPPPLPPEPAEEWQEPVWLHPPRNMLGGVVPTELLIGRSERAVVALLGIVAYPTGFTFTLATRRRKADPAERFSQAPFELSDRLPASRTLPPTLLRFGFQFSDGSKLTSVPSPPPEFSGEPAEPQLLQQGGHGDNACWDNGFWVWRLPPPGSVIIVCEWPAEEIGETRTALSSDEIRAAAGRARVLWDDPGPAGIGSSQGRWVAYGGTAASGPDQPEERSARAHQVPPGPS